MTKHGKHKSREYEAWGNMRQRCLNKKHKSFCYYGGRGIKVCKRWHKFENFYRDMGERPVGLELDRTDNYGDYRPSNCRWASRVEQVRNRRCASKITHHSKTGSVLQWSIITGQSVKNIQTRLSRGWSTSEAFDPTIFQNQYDRKNRTSKNTH